MKTAICYESAIRAEIALVMQGAIRAEIALLGANQIAGNTIDFKMNIINICIVFYQNIYVTLGPDIGAYRSILKSSRIQ